MINFSEIFNDGCIPKCENIDTRKEVSGKYKFNIKYKKIEIVSLKYFRIEIFAGSKFFDRFDKFVIENLHSENMKIEFRISNYSKINGIENFKMEEPKVFYKNCVIDYSKYINLTKKENRIELKQRFGDSNMIDSSKLHSFYKGKMEFCPNCIGII